MFQRIPWWAWVTGLMLGLAVAIPMFDNIGVALIFAVSIGMAFAIPWGVTERKK